MLGEIKLYEGSATDIAHTEVTPSIEILWPIHIKTHVPRDNVMFDWHAQGVGVSEQTQLTTC